MHILSSSDRVMINYFSGSTDVAIYGMAYTASTAVTSAWTAIQGSLSPFMLRHQKDKNYAPMGKVGTLCISGFSVLCLLVCAIAPEIIYILGGEKYVESVKLIPPLMASVLFMEMYNLFATVEFYHKKTTAIMFATITATLLNIILNGIFLPIFGYQAAAYTTLICYIIYCAFHYINMRRIQSAKIYDLKKLILLSLLYVFACFCCLWLYDFPIIRYVILVVIAGLCLLFFKPIIRYLKK